MEFTLFLLIALILSIVTASRIASSFIIVETEYGPVKGVQKSSILGRAFKSFQGIPYIKPPLGKLRFREAQPPESWTEPLDVTSEPPAYCNFNCLSNQLEGHEDAAVINVYAPQVETEKLFPVMVFIHGGGFEVS